MESPKLVSVKTTAQWILSEVNTDKKKADLFSGFAISLYNTLDGDVLQVAMPLSSAKARQLLWKSYHRTRSNKLVGM